MIDALQLEILKFFRKHQVNADQPADVDRIFFGLTRDKWLPKNYSEDDEYERILTMEILDRMTSLGWLISEPENRPSDRFYYISESGARLVDSYENKSDEEIHLATVEKSDVDYLPKMGFLSEIDVFRLKSALEKVGESIQSSGASNKDKAQARAYYMAIIVLADAPEPPADIIWDIVSKASHIAGIASLFVAIIALYEAIAH